MIEITRQFWFSMGHTLHDYHGKCANLHGHNYCLEVTVGGELDDQGMVMDFGDLKMAVTTVLDQYYDHHFLVNQADPRAGGLVALDPVGVRVVGFNPTAENLVRDIKAALPEYVTHLKLWETEDCYAEV